MTIECAQFGGREQRGTIPNQASIDLPPAIVGDVCSLWRLEGRSGHRRRQETSAPYALTAYLPYTHDRHVTFMAAQADSEVMLSLLTPFASCVQPTAIVVHMLRRYRTVSPFQLSAIPPRKIGRHHNALRNHNGPFIKVTPVDCRRIVIQSFGCLQHR